jgi:hypothetical protein
MCSNKSEGPQEKPILIKNNNNNNKTVIEPLKDL